MQTAYIHDGVIAELVIVPEGFALADVRTADDLAQCVQVPDTAQLGWVTTDGGKTIAAPLSAAGPSLASAT